MSDTTPFQIDERDLAKPHFTHTHVRGYISGAMGFIGRDPTKRGYRKGSLKLTVVLQPQQPTAPELEQFAGYEIESWLRAYGSARDIDGYVNTLRAFGLDPVKPELDQLKNVPIVFDARTADNGTHYLSNIAPDLA